MTKTIIVAIAAWLAGAVVGVLLCHVTISRLRRRVRELRLELRGKCGGMGTMDKILIFEAVVLILYTVADMVVFWHVGAEPTTLTACVFGVCGLENGVMGWIKTNKDKSNGPGGADHDGGEPTASREEPPDVGN